MTRIDIRPESDVYTTYRRLSYELWNAIAEFVDNSTHNFAVHKEAIAAASGAPAVLTVQIFYDRDNDTLVVADDAHGMNLDELHRAVQLNRPPEDRSGRSEFGMGLKMACCWLGSRWRIVTKRLGSDEELTVEMDLAALSRDKSESIPVGIRKGVAQEAHYTRIEIEGLHKKFHTRTLGKASGHLASIYRRDIRDGEVVIKWNREPISWDDDPVFEESLPDGSSQRWEKTIAFEIEGLPVRGRAWIRIPGDAKRAGLHLFRRGRLITGGPGKGYKPDEIFEAVNQYPSQRVVGEIDLDDWPVSMTKDAIDWTGDLEHHFIVAMKDALTDYVEKCKHIKRDKDEKGTYRDPRLVADASSGAFRGEEVEAALIVVDEEPVDADVPKEMDLEELRTLVMSQGDPIEVEVGVSHMPRLQVWYLTNQSEADCYATFACPTDDLLQLTINLNHPYVSNFIGGDDLLLQTWAQLLYVEALVERSLRKRGTLVPVSSFRQLKDRLLRSLNAP